MVVRPSVRDHDVIPSDGGGAGFGGFGGREVIERVKDMFLENEVSTLPMVLCVYLSLSSLSLSSLSLLQ